MFLIENLNFEIDGFTLHVDKLDLSNHKVAAIMGPSGAGKTTLFQTLIGIYQPQRWSWLLNGCQMSDLKIDERNLGVVFQKHELFPHMTAAENIQIVMKARGAISDADIETMNLFKKKLKLDSCWNTRAENLSGGEAQRISLLRAIMSKPTMLLLDEPFSALDAELKDEARRLTAEVITQLDLRTLIITHDVEDAKALNAHVVHINNGHIV